MRDFSVFHAADGPNDELEREWSVREQWAVPLVRSLMPDLGPPSEEQSAAIRVLVAMHVARSIAIREAINTLWVQHADPLPGRLEHDPDIRAAFEDQYGRPAEPGEIEQFTAAFAEKELKSNVFFVEQQTEQFNKLLDYLEHRPVSVARVVDDARGWLVTSDSPVNLYDLKTRRASRVGDGVFIGDEDALVIPLTRQLVAAIGHGTLPTTIGFAEVRAFNEAQIGSAIRFVVANPNTDRGRVAPFLDDFARV